MELYNKHDVLSSEELYDGLQNWDNTVNFEVYEDGIVDTCVKCGHRGFKKNGLHYTNTGKFQRYKCKNCKYETKSKQNLLTLEKRKSLKPGT